MNLSCWYFPLVIYNFSASFPRVQEKSFELFQRGSFQGWEQSKGLELDAEALGESGVAIHCFEVLQQWDRTTALYILGKSSTTLQMG